MTAAITAAARTPWAPRHGALDGVRPEQLLAAALGGVLDARGLDPSEVALVLVACDTGVGAQDLNLGRRTVVDLGWENVPALTVDGQGVGDLGLVRLVAGSRGASTGPGQGRPVIVAAVDCTSMVPPGAGLVRDYGRPPLDTPRQKTLDDWARQAGITREALDEQTMQLLAPGGDPAPHVGVVSVPSPGGGASAVTADVGVELDTGWAELAPLSGPEGIMTAFHEAPLADGACAVVIEHAAGAGTRQVSAQLTATADRELAGALAAAAPAVLADPNAVPHLVIGGGTHGLIPPVRALGSTPSANGLRCLVDAVHATQEDVTIVEIGAHGQLARVDLSAS